MAKGRILATHMMGCVIRENAWSCSVDLGSGGESTKSPFVPEMLFPSWYIIP